MMKKKALTLVEVVITIAIIAILAGVGVTAGISVSASVKRSICAERQVIILKALEQYLYRNPRGATMLNLETDLGALVGDPKIFRCPCDGNGGISYAFDDSLETTTGDRWVALNTLKTTTPDPPPILWDSDDQNSGDFAYRHGDIGGEPTCVAINSNSIRIFSTPSSNWGAPLQRKDY